MTTIDLTVIGHLGIDNLFVAGVHRDTFFGGSVTHFLNGLSISDRRAHIISACDRRYWQSALDFWQSLGHSVEDVKDIGRNAHFDCCYDEDLKFIAERFAARDVPNIAQFASSANHYHGSRVHICPMPVSEMLPIAHSVGDSALSVQIHKTLLTNERDRHDFRSVVELSDIVCLDLEEAIAYAGTATWEDALNILKRSHAVFFVTDELRAMAIGGGHHVSWFRSCDVMLRDPTGAGDTFAGGVIGSIMGGASITAALINASLAASLGNRLSPGGHCSNVGKRFVSFKR